ncbi:neuromedin-U isoform X1 [Poeciliopsis prolifica]|uniref:neuromedin-U isoform X1 n=1 Tax=Poeciliopsis prolifica TaxID=188132 RepID=UPI002412F951|nr:neuromedin-U isoform X1 [Poeciliopsis prolifica]
MKTFSSQSQPEQRGALCTLHSLSSGAMSPLSTASVTLAVLFILTIPASTSAPVSLQQVTTDQRQLLRQIDAVCSSYLSAGLKYWTSDVIGELCILMLVQKSKELRVQENSKRFSFHYARPQDYLLSQGENSQLHPLLHLVSQLHPRRERGLVMSAELQGPGGIESRGYFLYRVCVRQVVTGSKSCTLNNRNYKLLFALIATKWKTVFRI